MNFDLGKQKRESKGLDPGQLRSYFQAAGRNAFRTLSKGPPKAHKEAWDAEGVAGPNPLYDEGGFLLIRVDPNDADDFDATNVISIPRDGEDTFSVEAIKMLDMLEKKHVTAHTAPVPSTPTPSA